MRADIGDQKIDTTDSGREETMTGENGSNNPVPNFYRASAADFKKISGSPIVYWVSERLRNTFVTNDKFSDHFFSDGLTKTGDNAKYLRFHWEVSKNVAINPDCYRICVKGGDARNYFGNTDILVNWYPDVRNHYRSDNVARITPEYLWDACGISWTKISSKGPTFRWFGHGMIAETGGPAIFVKNNEEKSLLLQGLGFLASKVSWSLLTSLNPTLNFQTSDVLSLPLNVDETKESCSITEECIGVSKSDWDSYETSWDFATLPLLRPDYRRPTLKETYETLRAHWQEMTLEMQRLEEENNRIFIEAYGLQDELTPDVPLSEITLTCNPHYRYNDNKSDEELEALLLTDTVKEFISYTVGCMFGRYSLDTPGLILANQGETIDDFREKVPEPSFLPDDDNIIPILDDEYFTDDIVTRFKEFLKVTFGREHLYENLEFIAGALSDKGNSSPEEVLRNYFLKHFYADHVQRYKGRPIYWLFSSGKQQGFNALIYMHRYERTTLAKMRTDYLLELESRLDARLQMLSSDPAKNKTKITKIRKQLEEITAYDEHLNNKALALVEIDLDDGVVVNYGKFKGLVKEI